jgi:hypothetical protein
MQQRILPSPFGIFRTPPRHARATFYNRVVEIEQHSAALGRRPSSSQPVKNRPIGRFLELIVDD